MFTGKHGINIRCYVQPGNGSYARRETFVVFSKLPQFILSLNNWLGNYKMHLMHVYVVLNVDKH